MPEPADEDAEETLRQEVARWWLDEKVELLAAQASLERDAYALMNLLLDPTDKPA